MKEEEEINEWSEAVYRRKNILKNLKNSVEKLNESIDELYSLKDKKNFEGLYDEVKSWDTQYRSMSDMIFDLLKNLGEETYSKIFPRLSKKSQQEIESFGWTPNEMSGMYKQKKE